MNGGYQQYPGSYTSNGGYQQNEYQAQPGPYAAQAYYMPFVYPQDNFSGLSTAPEHAAGGNTSPANLHSCRIGSTYSMAEGRPRQISDNMKNSGTNL